MTDQVKVIVSGALGRMGQTILRLAAADDSLCVIGALEAEDKVSPDVPSFSCGAACVAVSSDLARLQAPAGSVLIEFTSPAATQEHVAQAASMGIGMVIGTTGLTAEANAAIADASKRIPVLVASNMSVGVNVLLGTVARLSQVLRDFDIEIVEMHHRHKKDAPSGTAESLAKAAASGRGLDFASTARYGREGIVGERTADEIGIHAVRGGDVVGDHTVIFAREGERIELIHRAHSRDTFAAGALRAAKFVAGRQAGLYSMQDVLGL